MFLMNSGGMYNLLSNSTQNKRGVGIVYKKGLALNVIRTALDPEENFLVALVKLNNNMLILASIYGPNVHNPYFFQLLYRELKAMGDHPIVIGGDFNATFSKDTVEFNIDCIAMNDVPNIRHSNYINEFCEALNLMDSYRFLYPNKKEFSYRPFGDKRKNRSRIDFFLISNELLNTKFECSISPALLASCFDHKPIFLSFLNNGNGARLGKKKLTIFESTLRDPDLDIVIWYTVLETYLLHFSVDPDLTGELATTLSSCGTVRQLLRDAGPDKAYYYNELTVEKLQIRSNNLAHINRIMDMLDLTLVHNFKLSISEDLFMEVLLNNLRNEISSYQAFIEKFKNHEFQSLLEQLKSTTDPEKADQLEFKLTQLNEIKIRDKLLHSNIYDVINNEKMTPQFLKLAKIGTNAGSLSELKDDTGTAFNSEAEARSYVITEYEKIYGAAGPEISVEDIHNFLGPQIANHEIIRNSKLPEHIKNELESDLSLDELDSAMATAKQTSAGGMDGLNNRALRRFWKVLRVPLFNY
jgi:exonuclease III